MKIRSGSSPRVEMEHPTKGFALLSVREDGRD